MKKVKLITVWAVNQGDDDRHSGTPHWWFSNEGIARSFAKGKGWYGGDAPVGQHTVLMVPAEVTESGKIEYYLADERVDVDGKEELEENRLKEQALAKLTPEEKRVLRL